MPQGNVQRIQDAVHGLMEFHGIEGIVLEILGVPELQRLRRIRQLGMAYFIFPGAEHSRFSHSLGTSHVAIRFVRQLQKSAARVLIPSLLPGDTAVRDLAVAALCHDLGHGPLSHAFEKEIVGNDFDRDTWIKALGLEEDRSLLKNAKWHEIIGHGLLAWPDGRLHGLLEQLEGGLSTRIRHLLRGEYHPTYLAKILRAEIDVDRADFIRRDTHQTGVAYGRYDLDWLISTTTVGINSQGSLVVGFDERKAKRVVEQFLIAHRAMYETVYYHKTVHCIEGMVGRFLSRLKDIVQVGYKLSVERLVRPYIEVAGGKAIGPAEIQLLDDFSLWVLLQEVANDSNTDSTLRDLATRIVYRDLFKLVPCNGEKIESFSHRPSWQAEIHDRIRKYCSGDPKYYLVFDPVELRFFSKHEEERSYFVGDNGDAWPIVDDHTLHTQPRVPTKYMRLFTIKEACADVAALIDSKV